jgi:hypothetical protein
MAWDKLRRLFAPKATSDDQIPSVAWIEAADNPWGVRVLDVRPVTSTLISLSSNPEYATNAVSFARDDGTSFVGQPPAGSRITKASLTFPIDRMLPDGVLFVPREMEQVWALFFHRGDVICVRSWEREVQVVAHLELHQDHVEVTQVRGTFGPEDEDPELTLRLFDYLLRSHALDLAYPVPLPAGIETDPKAAAMWCMSMFGDRAQFATPHRIERRDPEKPLRTHSLLHIAVARKDSSEIETHLAAGVPLDLLAGDGLAPLHWAIALQDTTMMAFLLDRGSLVDVRSSEGATPLMNAVQNESLDKVLFLLDRGADVNARDGHVAVAEVLLDRGAAQNVEAEGHTARSFAERHHHEDILAMFDRYEAGS